MAIGYNASNYKPSRYNLWYRGKNGVYLYNVLTTGLLALDEENTLRLEKIIDQPSGFSSFPGDEQRLLVDNGFFVPEKVDEIDMLKFRYRKAAFDKSRFNLILIPCKACNLACRYCFEREKTSDRMNREDCDQVLKFLEKEFFEIRPREFGIMWYGGEPLLGIDIMENIAQGIDQLCDKMSIRREKDAMITNGYLLDEKMAVKLKQIGVDIIQISLDGNREYHNRLRVLPDGRGTFDRLRQAIDIAQAHFSILNIRLNTNKENLPGVREILESDPIFKEKNVKVNIGPLRTYLGGQVKPEEDLECFGGPELLHIQHKLASLTGDTLEDNRTSGPYKFIIKENYCGSDRYKCFTIGPGSLVYKCLERIDPGEEVGIIHEGTFIPNQNYWGWAINEPFDHQACRDCLYLPICMGGCPSARKRLGLPHSQICGYWEQWLKLKLEKIDQSSNAG